MNRISGVMKTQLTDKFSMMILPWIIVSISFVVNIMIGSLSGEEIYTGGIASIYIYMLVCGIITVSQTFPFTIGLGVRRKDFLAGTVAAIMLISVGSAILLWVLGLIENELGGWGVELHFFHLPYISDSSVIGQIWTQLSFLLQFFFMGFVIACIYRRFGKLGLYTFFIVLFVIFTVSTFLLFYYDSWKQIADFFDGVSITGLASGMFLVTLVYILFSHLLLRRATG